MIQCSYLFFSIRGQSRKQITRRLDEEARALFGCSQPGAKKYQWLSLCGDQASYQGPL